VGDVPSIRDVAWVVLLQTSLMLIPRLMRGQGAP